MEDLIVEKAIQDIYPDDFAWCYGCGRLNNDGHHLRTGWQGEKKLLQSIHLNQNTWVFLDLSTVV